MKLQPSRKAFLATLAVLPATTTSIGAQAPAAPLRISTVAIESLMEPYYAMDLGLFTKAGIDPHIMAQTTGASGITGAVTGAVDIAASSVVQMASALLHGVPLQYVAPAAMWNSAAPNGGLVVASDSPIQTARDFEGKTIAINSLHDVTHLAALAYLIQNGADPEKVRFIELFFPAMLPAVRSGRVAGAVSTAPFLPVAGDGTRVLAQAYNAIAEHFMLLGFFSTAAWAKAHAAVARSFASVMGETAHWANDKANYHASAEIVEKYAKIPATATEQRVRITYGEQLDPGMIQPLLDWAYRVKFTERRVRAQELIAAV